MSIDEQLNFLPADYILRKGRSRATWAVAVIGVVTVIAVGVMVFHAERGLMAAERAHSDVCRLYKNACDAYCRARPAQQENRSIVERALAASSLVERAPRSTILSELANRLPDGASLTDVSLETRAADAPASASTSAFDMKRAALEARQRATALAPPEETATQVDIRLSGVAATDVDVARYLGELGRSRLFTDARLVVSEIFTPTPGQNLALRRFQIELTVPPIPQHVPRTDGAAATARIE